MYDVEENREGIYKEHEKDENRYKMKQKKTSTFKS